MRPLAEGDADASALRCSASGETPGRKLFGIGKHMKVDQAVHLHCEESVNQWRHVAIRSQGFQALRTRASRLWLRLPPLKSSRPVHESTGEVTTRSACPDDFVGKLFGRMTDA